MATDEAIKHRQRKAFIVAGPEKKQKGHKIGSAAMQMRWSVASQEQPWQHKTLVIALAVEHTSNSFKLLHETDARSASIEVLYFVRSAVHNKDQLTTESKTEYTSTRNQNSKSNSSFQTTHGINFGIFSLQFIPCFWFESFALF